MSVAYCTISGEWTLPGGGDPGRHPVIGVRYAGGAGIVTDDATGALVFSGVSAPVGGTLTLPVDGVLPDPGVDGLLWEATLRAAMAGGTEFTFTFRVPPDATALTWGEVVTDLLVESTGDPTSFAALAAAAQAAAADAEAAADAITAAFPRGTGSPEGVVTASVGTRYTDTAATTGAILWVKTTGTGNTGWKVAYGDTGWRDIAVSGAVAGFTVLGARIRRVGNTVSIANLVLRRDDGLATDADAFNVPTGFQSDQVYHARSYSGFPFYVAFDKVHPSEFISGATFDYYTLTYFTNDAWPTTLPGSAV